MLTIRRQYNSFIGKPPMLAHILLQYDNNYNIFITFMECKYYEQQDTKNTLRI